MKLCIDCEKEKPLSEFHKNSGYYRKRCKVCANARYQPATGNPNSGQYKPGDKPCSGFKKGNVPWNKGTKGKRIRSSQKYRHIAFNVYEKKCHVCMTDEELVVHHIDGCRENAEPSNLMPLCHPCHKKIHTMYSLGFDHEGAFVALRQFVEWAKQGKMEKQYAHK